MNEQSKSTIDHHNFNDFSIRTVMKNDGTRTDKLERLMLRIGFFRWAHKSVRFFSFTKLLLLTVLSSYSHRSSTWDVCSTSTWTLMNGWSSGTEACVRSSLYRARHHPPAGKTSPYSAYSCWSMFAPCSLALRRRCGFARAKQLQAGNCLLKGWKDEKLVKEIMCSKLLLCSSIG